MVTRYEYLQLLESKITDELITTNVGGVAKEWDHLKHRDGNLLQVYMAGATAMALGIAMSLPHRRVISLDGDGSILMGLGILPVLAHQNPSNLVVIVFDNEVYEAAANVPSFTAGSADLVAMARGAGILNAVTVGDINGFGEAIDKSFQASGTTIIVVKVEAGAASIPFYAMDGIENKYRFIRYIEETENIKIIKPASIKVPTRDEVRRE